MQIIVENHPCPHIPECEHSDDCAVAPVTFGNRTFRAHVVPGGGYSCPKCRCARAVALTAYLTSLLEALGLTHVFVRSDLPERALTASIRQSRRLDAERMVIRRYGQPTFMLTDQPVAVRGHLPFIRLPSRGSVALVFRLMNSSGTHPESLIIPYTREGVRKERTVRVGEVQRIDWSPGLRPPSKPRFATGRVRVGFGKPGTVRSTIKKNTPYDLDEPLPEDVNEEEAIVEVQDALSSRDNHNPDLKGAWKTTGI